MRWLVVVATLHAAAAGDCPSWAEVNINGATGSANWEENPIYPDLYVTPCTKLRFSYGSNHDVWLLSGRHPCRQASTLCRRCCTRRVRHPSQS